MCRSVQHSGGLTYVAINSTALTATSLHLGATVGVQVSSANVLDTDLQIGTLWADHATQVQQDQAAVAVENVENTYMSQTRQPYRGAARTLVRGTVTPLTILVPEVLTMNALFNVTIELKDSTGNVVESVLRPACGDACTTESLPSEVACTNRRRACGDVSLPRTFSLSAYGLIQLVHLHCAANATQGNQEITTARDLTNEVAVGENLHIMAGSDSSTFTHYYIKAITATTITLDRQYYSTVLTDAVNSHVISTLYTKRDPLQHHFGEDGTDLTAISSVPLTTSADMGTVETTTNLKITTPAQGVYLQANDQTCYKVASVTLTYTDVDGGTTVGPSGHKVSTSGCLTGESACLEGRYEIVYMDKNQGVNNAGGPYWPPTELGVDTLESAGMQIYLDGPDSVSTKVVTVASVIGTGSKGFIDEASIAATLHGVTHPTSGQTSAPCLRFGTEFSLTLKATDDARTLSSGYFSLFITHRGTTETTSRIYYVCDGSSCPYPTVNTEAAFLANVQAAIAALPNVPHVLVKTRPSLLAARANYQTKETGLTLLFYGVDRTLTVAFNEKQIVENDGSDDFPLDISATTCYILLKQSKWNAGTTLPPTDDNQYSTRVGPLSVASPNVAQLRVEDGEGIHGEGSGWVAKEKAAHPFIVRADDMQGALVKQSGLGTLTLEAVDDGRFQRLYCTASEGDFTLQATLRDGVTVLTTRPIPYNGVASDIRQALDELYAPVGTAAAATGQSTVAITTGNVHVLSFVRQHTTVRLNSDGANCTAGQLYNIKSVNLMARTFELTTAFAGATNTVTHICVQPFPKPKVSLGRSQTKICASGVVGGGGGITAQGAPLGNGTSLTLPMAPQPVTIRFDASTSVYWWDKYATLRADVSNLAGSGGQRQTFTCVAANANGGQFQLEYQGATTPWIDGLTDTVDALTTKLLAMSTTPSTLTVTLSVDPSGAASTSLCLVAPGRNITIDTAVTNGNEGPHEDTPPFRVLRLLGEVTVSAGKECFWFCFFFFQPTFNQTFNHNLQSKPSITTFNHNLQSQPSMPTSQNGTCPKSLLCRTRLIMPLQCRPLKTGRV